MIETKILLYVLSIVGTFILLLLSVVGFFLKKTYDKLDALDNLAKALHMEVVNQKAHFGFFKNEMFSVKERITKIEDKL